MKNVYDFTVKDRQGNDVSLSDYKGKVLLIVNTATGCGFTPHYEPLEKMYKELKDQGFEILDFPCNQFANQAPGTDDEIHEFCTIHYNTTFAQMKKSDVNGENELPLYTYLKSQKKFEGFGKGLKAKGLEVTLSAITGKLKEGDIRWNFTKFIIDKEGNVVRRFEPTEDMEEVEKFVVSLL